MPSSGLDVDNRGRNALHFAVKGGNLQYLKFLIEVEKFDPKTAVDFRGVNPIAQLIKGDRILTADVKMLSYLIEKGADTNLLYEEPTYNSATYKCTPLIHGIRHTSEQRDNIKAIILELINNGADACIQDSQGLDALVHVVKRNHENTFNYILDTYQEERKDGGAKARLVKDSVDANGWTLVHHIVRPLEFGSFENAAILKRALEEGF